MGRKLLTTESLIAEVRSLLDESNDDSVDDVRDILPALNRGLSYGVNLLARRYPEPFLTKQDLTLTAGESEVDIPEECFEDRVTKLEINLGNGQFTEVRRVSHSDATNLETSSNGSTPQCYTIIGRKIRLYPAPNGEYNARIWFLRQPDDLVFSQGRITAVNLPGNYVMVDAAGDDLSTSSDLLESYVNVVDGQTGLVKYTGQVANIYSGQITFRTTPIRDYVFNRDVAGPLPTAAPTVEADDYVCLASGTCVPQFSSPMSNFLVQFAVAECTRKLGGEAATEEQILTKFEKRVENVWGGRETTRRIKRRSGAWGTIIRKSWITQRN